MSVEYIEVRKVTDKHDQDWFKVFAVHTDKTEFAFEGSERLIPVDANRQAQAIAAACGVKYRSDYTGSVPLFESFAKMDNGQ